MEPTSQLSKWNNLYEKNNFYNYVWQIFWYITRLNGRNIKVKLIKTELNCYFHSQRTVNWLIKRFCVEQKNFFVLFTTKVTTFKCYL